jgi:uncharacterized protein DUF3631
VADLANIADATETTTDPDGIEALAQPHQPNPAIEIERLAKLDPVAYDRERKAMAEALGIRNATLDELVKDKRREGQIEVETAAAVEELDPWPDPVSGLDLAETMRASLSAHVIFEGQHDANLAALWALGSYAMDEWRLFPRLLITSPTKQCGKSTLLEVLEALTYRPMMAANASPAVMFRAIEKYRPTLLLDEADTWLRQSDELSGVINSGHMCRGRVLRAEVSDDTYEPRSFSTWAAMVIAGIGGQRDTLESRSVIITLRRKLPGEVTERLRHSFFDDMTTTRRRAGRWADDVASAISASQADPPDSGDDRRRDNFGPVFRIAEVLGGPWPDRAMAGYLAKAEDIQADEPAGVMMLADMIEAMKGQDRITTADLLYHILEMEDRPWAEWRHGKPIAAHGIARLLKPFGVRPVVFRSGGGTPRGYTLADVENAFAPYTPIPIRNTATDVENQGVTGNPIRNKSENVADKKKRNQLKVNECCGVADGNGGVGEEKEETERGTEWGSDF